MKEYMLIYKGGDPQWTIAASEEDMAAAMERWGAWMEELQQKDQLASGGSPLAYSGKRLAHDGVMTDINASEFKELVTGYSIVKADSIDEAVKLARACPIWEYPDIQVEVREVRLMD